MTPEEIRELLLLFSSFLASGFYSGAEAALVSLPVDRTKQLIEEGGKKGQALMFLNRKQNSVLTTILVGNNLVNIFAASYATLIASRYFDNNAIAYSTGIMTLLILIFGEIIPKTFARVHAERLAYPIIKVLQFNYYLLYPFIKTLTWFIAKVLGKNARLTARVVTKDDIEYMVSKAEKEKSIDSKQLDMLNSILEFPTIKVKDIMVPRLDVQGLDKNVGWNEVIKLVREVNHSRYPIFEGDLDTTIGLLHIKDLAYVEPGEQEAFRVDKYLKSPFFVYEHMKIQAVFDHMNRKKVHLALVKDENGLVVGIITLEDIMEEIFGEILDEHDDEEETNGSDEQVDLEEGLTVEGDISLRDLYNEYDVKIPLNDNYSTLRGFLLDMLGNNFPSQGNIIVWEGLSFELTLVENFEIEEVKITDVEGEGRLFNKNNASRHDEDQATE